MKKIFIYLFGLVNVIVVIAFWWQGSGSLLKFGNIYAKEIAIGRLLGLCGEMAILTQLILIGRIRFIEQEFGHDKMNTIHRTIGYSIVFFFLLHPFLLILGYSGQNEASFISQFFNFIINWEDVIKAFIALIIFLIIISVSLPYVRRKIKYEYWYFTHILVYVAIFLVFGHQIKTADVSFGAALYYWLILNFGIGGLFILFRFVRPWYSFFRHGFYVDRVVPETHDVYSVYIKGKNLKDFKFEAGQFSNYTFFQKGMWYTHPFSFSKAPDGNSIRISVKGVGDYTRKISSLKPGTKVLIDGPLGIFTEKSSKKDKYLFIAGGIGITPLRSLIESLSKKGRDIILLYGNKSQKDIAFEKELRDFVHKYHIILSEISDAQFEQGYINEERISRLAPDYKEREVYLCGPVPMMKSVLDTLKKLEIPQKHVHFERFGY
jgi:predicted ferric reductase